MNKTISILGCGWVGIPLAKELIKRGFEVKGSTTTPEKLLALSIEGIVPCSVKIDNQSSSYEDDFFKCDTLIISLPPKRNETERNTYVEKIQRIKELAILDGITQLIFLSSTSVYGDLNSVVNENTPPKPETESGKILLQAEGILKESDRFKTTIVRFGGLIGPKRNPGRFMAGKHNIPNGLAPVNLIHQADCVGIITAVIDQDRYGDILNACAPDHPTRANFYTAAAEISGLEKPTFIDELTTWKIVKSDNVIKLLNYTFKLSEWREWIKPENL